MTRQSAEVEGREAALERRLDSLTLQVTRLQEQLEALTDRLDREAPAAAVRPENAGTTVTPPPVQEEMLSWAGREALLPRIAVICFILVVALILRTITDNRMVDAQVGSLLGMAYAVALIGWGWRLYAGNSRLAPVFPASGLLLLFSIVLESHARYESISTLTAYGTLLAAGFVVTVIGFRHQASALLCLCTVGIGLTAMAIDFPYPVFPVLGLLLFAANLSGYLAYRRGLCPTLRWAGLLLAFLFWLFWAFKLSAPPVCDEPVAAVLHLSWFFPLLSLFLILYTWTSVANSLAEELPQGFFDGLLPTVAAAGGFWAGWTVMSSWYPSVFWIGPAAVLVAVVYFVLAGWLARRGRDGATGSNTFAFAGSALLLAGLPVATDSLYWSLPVASVWAYILARLSGRWRSGGVRVTSYQLQLAVCAVALFTGAITLEASSIAGGLAAAAVTAVMSLLQYRWCRKNPPAAEHSAWFSWLDRRDRSAVVLLCTGLVSAFFLLQLAFSAVLADNSESFDQILRSAQSLLINGGGVLLLLWSLRGRNRELLVVACIVAVIGALKVFIFDLFGIKGVPLVLSVFSFGVVAAVASVVSGRWQHGKGTGLKKDAPEFEVQ